MPLLSPQKLRTIRVMDDKDHLDESHIAPDPDEALDISIGDLMMADFDMSTIPPAEEPIDVAAALAAVSELDWLARPEEAPIADTPADDSDEQDIPPFVRTEPETSAHPATAANALPPLDTLARGQTASILPALLLIGLGSGLMVLLNTGALTLSPFLIVPAGLGVLGVSLVAYWLSSRGFARGSLLVGLVLCASAIALYAIFQSRDGRTWPAILLGLAGALGLFSLLSPRTGRPRFWAFLLTIAGGIAWAYAQGWLADSWLAPIHELWPAAVVIVLVWLGAPLAARRRRRHSG